MKTSVEIAAAFAPIVYADSIREFQMRPDTDMSRSTKCHTMTLDMLRHLESGNIAVRRELHVTAKGLWHFVLAHTELDAEPTDSDIITDLNPWIFNPDKRYAGPLHAPRDEMQRTLYEAGAPASWIALHGLETVAVAHTKALTPFQIEPLPAGITPLVPLDPPNLN
jgi:hypothetical protein